jgi:hypothetical protein
MPEGWRPIAFIDEAIGAAFDQPPTLSKKPGPPDRFEWRGQLFPVREVVEQWFSYERRGRMQRNMAPEHAETAARRGSWGVGRFFFRVRVEGGRVFDLYYDRAPQGADDRLGKWILWRELEEG